MLRLGPERRASYPFDRIYWRACDRRSHERPIGARRRGHMAGEALRRVADPHEQDYRVRAAGLLPRLDHEHHFAEDGRGGTVMRDLFDFAAPFGALGWVAERLILTRYLSRFLEARN